MLPARVWSPFIGANNPGVAVAQMDEAFASTSGLVGSVSHKA
jgi:hypothetical protein